MTFRLDAHLDPRLAAWISGTLSVNARSFDELGYRLEKDHKVFAAAKVRSDVAIVTKDADFVELVTRLDKSPQIVWLTIGNTATPVLKSVLAGAMTQSSSASAPATAL